MTESAMAWEAVLATLAKGLLAFCLCAMALIIAREFWQFGRGMESGVWPEEAPEPETPDVPRSSDVRDVDASGGRGLQFRSVGAATLKENAASAIDILDVKESASKKRRGLTR